jgi:hypothetical protein
MTIVPRRRSFNFLDLVEDQTKTKTVVTQSSPSLPVPTTAPATVVADCYSPLRVTIIQTNIALVWLVMLILYVAGYGYVQHGGGQLVHLIETIVIAILWQSRRGLYRAY